MQGIYEIVNVADDKASSYVGSSSNIQYRFQQHRWFLNNSCHANPHLQAAWDKWGKDAFVFSILEEVEDSSVLLVLEQEYLDDYLDRGACYNIAIDVSAPTRGRKLTAEHKQKIGRGVREYYARMRAMGISTKRKPLSEEHRRKISETNKGRACWRKGKTLSEATKCKMSKAQKRSWAKGNRRKPSRGHWHRGHGHVWSEESRHQLSEVLSKPYPAFYNRNTGEYILPGKNLLALCRKYDLNNGNMTSVKVGRRPSHKGWVLANTTERRRIKNVLECT